MKLAMFIFLLSLTTAVAFARPLDSAEYVYMTCERNLEGLKCAVDNNEEAHKQLETELELKPVTTTNSDWQTEWIVGDAYTRLSAE